MIKNSYRFFRNPECEYFPCHRCTEKQAEDFNCLFCYCPLYTLGDKCGGNFTFTDGGIKDCSNCMLPHSPAGYDHIIKMYPLLLELMNK